MFTFTPQFILDSAVLKLYLTDLWNQFKPMAEAGAVDDDGVDLSEIPEDFDKAPGTIERRARIETRWKRYCASQVLNKPNERKWREPEEALRQASNNDMYRFLGWCLKLERGKNNRRLKRINKASSLNTDWKNLRGYYQKLTKIKINDEDGSDVRRGMKYLVQEHGLDTQPGKKTPVYIEDIGPFNETILSTQEKKFYLGFQRIQVCLFNSLGLFTVHRRAALLSLQFKDLQISLQKDPRGGPPIPMIELTPEGTKKFLGLTKLTTFALPEIVYGPSLVICPHTLLFGILFHAGAFRNSRLTSKAQLRKLFISKGCEQLLVPLDPNKSDWYIFCKTELVNGAPTIQRTVPMSKSTMSTLLVTFGEIRGWKGAFHAHQFRYGGGKVINESGWVSKEQHMLIMKHASPRTFLDHYHPLQIDTDMIRVICGLDPDVELMRAVTRQSRWRDTRRPRYLTDHQRAQLEDHPELEEARRNLSQIRAQYEKTQQPALLPRIQQREKEVRNTRKRLQRSLRHQIRENFDEEQAFLDIEAQLSGTVVKEESEDESSLEDTMHPFQLHLVQSLLSYPISNSLEDEWNRRDTGAAAVVQYCDVLEGGPLRGRPKRNASESVTSAGPINQPQDAGQSQNVANSCEVPVSVAGKPSRATKEYLENSEKPEACFQCFANKGLADHVRFQMYHDAGCVTRHFDAIHLKEKPLKCNWCEVALLHQMAFQRHAFDVHRVRSRKRCPNPVQELQTQEQVRHDPLDGS
ncbi:C2H2 finger domain protein [Penicillium brasilianum]|uniref:C2H2 finger domain protein n=1 Tax=Penicillium brasilianum TaxID=104259 RepID=A0A1S9S1K9_PENBI|nr:C2H2 finger domain protein [Penicillium brasilianum]